jgi:hypothetical protein
LWVYNSNQTEKDYKLTDKELNDLISLLQLHTALGRIGHGELVAAIRKAEAHGYKITK